MGWWPTNTFYKGVPCPSCGMRLARGYRRFGPAYVRCGNCKATIPTGFHRWPVKPRIRGKDCDTRTWREKAWQGLWKLWMFLSEMSLPSGMGIKVSNNQLGGPLLLFNVMCWFTVVYPAWLLWRFICMVRECKGYERTGVPPVWFPIDHVSSERIAYRRPPVPPEDEREPSPAEPAEPEPVREEREHIAT